MYLSRKSSRYLDRDYVFASLRSGQIGVAPHGVA